jgi:dipeptidyl aminopeptidase/acylaminoacyl peptidase
VFLRPFSLPLATFVLGILALVSRAADPKPKEMHKPLAVEDLYLFDGPQDVTLAPDGKTAVFIRHWIDAKTKRDRFSLWSVAGSADKAQALESGEPDARAPVFSPDGRWIAFQSTRARPKGWKQTRAVPPQSDPATDVWLLSTSGGPAIALAGTKKPYGRVFNDGFYGRLSFSRDGKKLAFVADDGKDPRTAEEIRNDVIVVRPDQGEGYTGYDPAQVWVAHLDEKPGDHAASRIDRLTKDDVWYGDPQWSPDGRTLVVHANRTAERESVRYSINRNFDLFAIDVASGKFRQLTHGPGPEVSPRFSPDGKSIACLSVPRCGSHRDVFNLALVSLEGETPTFRVLFDHHDGKADRPPHPAPSFPLPLDCWEDDTHLAYNAEAGTGTHAIRLDLRTGRGERVNLSAKEAETKSKWAQRQHLRQQLTPAGNLFLRERKLGRSEILTWKEKDGAPVEGILTRPPDGIGKAPYPLVVFPHGGPHSRSALGFDFTVQVLAAQGYAIFQPNFRGSSGYGQKFIDADRFDFGGGDMRDILAGVDELVRKGTADGDRLFVYGVSYGGFMTCWLVGQTHRFRAAVAQNAVTDLDMMWALSDLQTWTEWEFGGLPWEVPERMRQHSPLTHAAKVNTPTLILHSRDDRRCPLPMGLAFHQALRARGVPTQMVIYPGEGHGIRQPRHREDVLRRIMAWFAKYDKK